MVHIEGQWWWVVWSVGCTKVSSATGSEGSTVNSAAPAACAFLMGSKKANPVIKLLSLADY